MLKVNEVINREQRCLPEETQDALVSKVEAEDIPDNDSAEIGATSAH